MITTIVVLVLVLGGVAVFASARSWSNDERDTGPRTTARAIGTVMVLVGVVAALFATLYVVQGYQTGVPVTFGNVGHPVGAGLHAKAPWTSIEKYPTRPLTVDDTSKLTVRTAQGGQFTVRVAARWSAADARELYFQVRTGDVDKISDTVVEKALAQSAQNVYSTLQNTDAINNRQAVENALLAELQRQLTPFGIKADNIFLRLSEPDATTEQTINQLTAQQQATKVAIASQTTNEQLALAQKITATGIKNAAAQLPTNLTPTQLQALCIQAWERQVSAATAKGIVLYTSPCGNTPQVLAR